MPSVVQNQSQVDETLRKSVGGRAMPFLPGQVRPGPQPEQRLQAQERRKMPKGFMSPATIQMLMRMFMRQRG